MPVQGGRTVVELVGLAGAGKSTLARELAAEPAVQLGLPLTRVRSAVAQATAMAPFAVPYLRETRGSAWFTRDEVRGLGYLRAWQKALTLRRAGSSCVVLDHGPLFRLAQLDAVGPPVTSTAAFRRWWEVTLDEWADLLDVVVWLDAPEELLVNRIRSRDQRHVLRNADDDAARRFLGSYRRSYAHVIDLVRQRSPGAVLSLRTDVETPASLARQVTRRISREAQLDV
jgi:shikimate kinase